MTTLSTALASEKERLIKQGFRDMGFATPDQDPGLPHSKVFYLATELGTYEKFGNVVVESGDTVLLIYDTSLEGIYDPVWGKISVGVPKENGGGSTVELLTYYTSGTRIATMDIDGDRKDIFVPKSSGGGLIGEQFLEATPAIRGVSLKPQYQYLNVNQGFYFNGYGAGDGADFEVQVVEIDSIPTRVLHSRLPLYSDSWISAGGISTGGGPAGITDLGMWKLLTNNPALTSYNNYTKISQDHIPDIYQPIFNFTITGASGAIYDLATISANAALGASAYSSLTNGLFVAGTSVRNSADRDTLLGINAISYNLSSDNNDVTRIEWVADAGGLGVGAWHIKGNLYADGWISAGGVSNTPGQSPGNASYIRIDGNGGTITNGIDSVDVYSRDYITNALAAAGSVKTVALVNPNLSGDIPLADLAGAFTGAGYKLTDTTYSAGTGLALNGTTFSVSPNTYHPYQGSASLKIIASQFTFDTKLEDDVTESTLTWDNTNKAWKITGNLYTTGWMSAGGVSSTPGQLPGNASYTRLDGDGGTITNGIDSVDVYSRTYITNALAAAGRIQSVVKGTATAGGAVTTTNGVVTIQFPTDYSLPLAGNSTRGGIQIGYTDSTVGTRNYAVQLSSEKAFVNVPWTDTTYSAGTGLTLTGTTFSVTANTFHPYQGDYNIILRANKYYLSSSVYFELDNDGYVHLVTPSGGGFYTDGWISAGGISSGGGASGIDALAMWRLLTNNSSLASYDNYTKIAVDHIPDIASAYGYATQTWVGQQGYATQTWVGQNYLPLTGGTMSNTNLVTNLNADLLDGNEGFRYLGFIRYSATYGVLIRTDISVDAMFHFVIKGNSYFETIPVLSEVQGYWYRSGSDNIIAVGAINFGHHISSFKVFVYDGVICLWFAETSNYQTYQVECFTNYDHVNHVTATYNEAFPSSATKTVTITPKNVYVGLDSTAIGSTSQTIYYNGSSFVAGDYFIKFSGDISPTATREIGYGNSGSGWYTTGPAMSFGATSYTMQIQSPFAGGGIVYRNINNDVAGSWYKIWTEQNDGSGSGLDADLLDGQQGSYYFSTGGGAQMGYSGTQLILASNDYSSSGFYNGGIQLREYNFAGTNAQDNQYGAPGITFHWADRAVQKLWMTGSMGLKWGDYNVWTSADNFARQNYYDSTRDYLNTAYSTTEFSTSYGPNEIQNGDKCVLTIPTWSGNSANDYQQTQLVFPLNYADIKIRAVSNGTVVSGPYWILHSGNYGSYALPRTAGSSYPLSGGLYFNDISGEKAIIANYRSGGVYGMLYDHYNGNVSLNACGDGLYYGYWNTTGHHFYTNGAEKVIINSTGQIQSLVADGTAPMTITSASLVSNLNADLIDGYHLKDWTMPLSPRDFANGTLITTDISYDGYEGEAFYMEISGDMYNNYGSLFTQVSGYFYSNTLINYCTTDIGKYRIRGLIAMNIDGKLCFWFPRLGYWQSFRVKCYSSSSGNYWRQRATSITNSSDPGGTRRVNLMTYYYQSAMHGENYAANYITAGSTTLNTSYPLYVVGTIASTGDQVITSDAIKKTNPKDLTYTLEQIANAPAISFDWKDKPGHSFGSIAQYWKPICPEMVEGEEGNYSLAYAQGAFVNGIIIAREVKSLKDKLVPLFEKYEPIFNKVNTHEDRINDLTNKLQAANDEIFRLNQELTQLKMSRSYGME